MRIGVCGRNDTHWPVEDFEAIRRGKFGSVKLMSQTDPAVFARLKQDNPDLLLITRLYHPSFNTGGHLPASRFVAEMGPIISRLTATCQYFQIHNEPNHRDGIEGWGASDAHAVSFNRWFVEVYQSLKSAFPDCRFGFPGLAMPDFAHRDWAWLHHCRQAITMADWLGVHCYWQSPPGQDSVIFHPNFGLNFEAYHRAYPHKPLHVLECGNSNCQNAYPLSGEQQADEYVRWVERVAKCRQVESVNFFILSSPDPFWNGFKLVGQPVIDRLAACKPRQHEPPAVAGPRFTNQQVINAFWRAEQSLGIALSWSLLSRAGLSVDDLAGDRAGRYDGPPLTEALKRLTPSDRKVVARELGITAPTDPPRNLEMKLAQEYEVDVKLIRAVLQMESGGRGIRNGRCVIRFEPHVFWDNWGNENAEAWGRHFKVGQPRWVGSHHRCRLDGEWRAFHGNQDTEWRVYELAKGLDAEEATRSISMGLGQIMGFHYRACGYDSAQAMLAGFSESEERQMEGMFRLIASKPNWLKAMRDLDFDTFGRLYNGSASYGTKLRRVYESLS